MMGVTWEALGRKDPKVVVGLISGTSADGIDAAVVRVRGAGFATRVEVLHARTVPLPPADRSELFALFAPPAGTVDRVCAFNVRLGTLFADAALAAIRGAALVPDQVDLIGSHGQTIYHIPPAGARAGATLQIGEPAVIAERTGIPVVSDFRAADMAAGGHGAPLVPYLDYVFFRDPRRSRAVQNLGGIGNVTHLPSGGRFEAVLAFDTGPGNMVINGVVELATAGAQQFDRDGAMAARGRADRALLEDLLRDPYFAQTPPKSTGRERYGRDYAQRLVEAARGRGLSDADAVATATMLTVETIARAYRDFLLPRGGVDDVILCGGGSLNPVLRARLAAALAPAAVRTTDDLGLPGKAKEAVAFAVLAAEAVAGRPANVPSATGAAHPVVLGKLIPSRRMLGNLGASDPPEV